MSEIKIEEVLKRYADSVMPIFGAVGVGQDLCDGEPCIKVFLIKKTRELKNKIPRELKGYKVKNKGTGKVKACPES